MAFGTGDLLVHAFQPEPCTVVIKNAFSPIFGAMTFCAISYPIYIKLSGMRIRMTFRTRGRKSFEFLCFKFILFSGIMTIRALCQEMSPLELEICKRMIKIDFFPESSLVAGRATLIWIIFVLDKSFVFVFMTIHTGDSNIFKTPVGLFLVAREARGCQVSAFQLKF